ncbi:hypothetical protein [Nostoc sp.]|uniref:hypothetical protein n=1 Tax=Nostoc sp. TaxID=1180 RepID=UPI002FFBF80E
MSNDSAATAVRLFTCNTSAKRFKGQRQNIKQSVKFYCQKKLQIVDAIAYLVLVAPLQY